MTGEINMGFNLKAISLPIPIFYKLLVSMLFVAVLPVLMLGIVSTGNTITIIETIGLQNAVFVLTLITLTIVMMWSFFLARSIVSPIESLSRVATSVSKGELLNSDIDVMTNDEIGELALAFSRLVNSYKILDTLAREDMD